MLWQRPSNYKFVMIIISTMTETNVRVSFGFGRDSRTSDDFFQYLIASHGETARVAAENVDGNVVYRCQSSQAIITREEAHRRLVGEYAKAHGWRHPSLE